MVQRDGQYFQRQWRVSPGGQEIHVQESRIDYVMGSGNHVRSYLHRTARGALTELPLAWYAENGGTWAHESRARPRLHAAAAHHRLRVHVLPQRVSANSRGARRTRQRAALRGQTCPKGSIASAATDRAPTTYASPKLPGSSVEAIRKAIVNPARLPSERQMEVCMQCHLETTSLPLPHSIVRYGRAPFSYQPGEPLGNFMIFFDHAAGQQIPGRFRNRPFRVSPAQIPVLPAFEW